MKIQRVTFLGIRGVDDASYEFAQRDATVPADVVVVTGRTGSGKTRLLEALITAKEAVVPYGTMVKSAPWIASGAAASRITVGFWLDEEERAFAGSATPVVEAEVTFLPNRAVRRTDEGLVRVLGRYEHGTGTGKLEYFSASRRLLPYGPFTGLSVLEQRITRASKDPYKYGFVVRFLREIESDAAAGKAFAERLAALSTTLRYERGVPTDGLPRCFASRGGPPAGAAELSDSEADAVLFAATATLIDLQRSIVIVDRPDLYADPAEIGRVLLGLTSLGKNNQLIVASNSPELLASAPNAQVLKLGHG